MHHLKPSSKGDPLCPLGFHPQVRWPTRCKRCFRDYKEHGNKKDSSSTPALRKDEFTLSTPTLSVNSYSRSRTDDRLQDNTLGSRAWTSSTNLSTLGTSTSPSHQISDQLSERTSSWTSSPNLADTPSSENVTVSITLPRRRRPVQPNHQQDPADDRRTERRKEYERSNSENVASSRDSSSYRDTSSTYRDSSTRKDSSSYRDSSSTYRDSSTHRDSGSSYRDSSTHRDSGSSYRDSSTHRDSNTAYRDTSTHRDSSTYSDSSSHRDTSSYRDRSSRYDYKDRKSDYQRPDYRSSDTPRSEVTNSTNTSTNKPDVDFIFHVKSLSGQKGKEANRSSSRRGSSSSDDAPTVTTDTTLVNMRENQLLEEIESLKKELDTVKTRCEKAEREKSDLMFRRLATLETTSTKSESLKLQQKVNELKGQVEDLRDEKRSLTIKVREVESELDAIKATGAQREVEQLRTKMDKAEQLIEQLMEENQDMRREIRDMEEEMLEMQDTFREDQADEYSSLKKELEQTTKKCRILAFKLKKSERKTEQLDAEKLDMERKIREIAGGQAGLDKAERIRQLERELKVANEAALRLQKDLDEAQSKVKEGTLGPAKKKTPMLGTIPKTPSAELKVSRESLVRGGSQEDPAQLLRDLQDSLEREADLREQLKHAEEEVEIFRKKASRVEEDNESLVMQLKKMATKARSRRLSPTANRLNPEEKDEGISDEDDPADLRIQLELNEQEACVLRRKVEELETERDAVNRKNKDLQDKLTAKLSTVAKKQELHSGDSNSVYQHKIKVMEAETSDIRMKLIEKERECERLHAEIALSNKKPKLLQKSKSLDGDQATVDLKRQLQVIESEAAILRTKIQGLESDNEKLLTENKRLIMLKGTRRAGSVERSDEPKPLVVATLEKQLEDANKKIKELQADKDPKKDQKDDAAATNAEDVEKLKTQLKKAETAKKKLEESLERIKNEASLESIEFFSKRKPRQATLQTTKQQLKKWVDDSENDINELLLSLKKVQQDKGSLPNGTLDKAAVTKVETEKKKLETELKQLKEQSDRKDKELVEIKEKIQLLEQDKSKSKKDTDSSKTVWEKEKVKLTAAKDELDKKKLDLEKQLSELQTEIKELKKSKEEAVTLKKKVDTITKSLEVEKKQTDDLKKQLKESNEFLVEDKNKLVKQLEAKDKLATEQEKAFKELEEKLKKSEKLTATKKEKLVKLEKEKSEKEKKLEETEKSVASLKDEKKELASQLEEHESKIKQLKSQLDSKKKTIEQLEKSEATKGKGVSTNSDELRRLREELETKQASLEEQQTKYNKVSKEKEDLMKKLETKENDLKKETEHWQKKLSDLENDLQVAKEEATAERKMMERLKSSQELEMKAKEQEIAQLQTKNLTSGTKKFNDLKHEMQSKIDRLEMALESEKKEYEELTGKYEELEEEHVVMKAQLVKEKETVQSQMESTEEELKKSASELRTLRETFNIKQDLWIKEKHKFQEKIQDAEKKSDQSMLESQKMEAVVQGKQLDLDQYKKEINDLIDQSDRLRRENEELRRQMEDFDKVVKVQRNMNADVDALEKEIKEYKTRLVMEEKSRKKELVAQKARYDKRVSVLSNELLGAQGQVARFKKERDSYKKILEETQRQLDRTGNTSGSRLSYDGESAVAQLEQQVGCLEEELSEARLEASRLRTELMSEKSAWELKLSELTSKLNEMEEEKVLSGGRTKITGVRTRMELAWQKEREEQQRLLQETSTLARDLRQTLFEVERERDRERLESKRRLEQVKRNSDEEHEDLKKKLHDMQCDLLELRDAHAKLRTTNEKLRRERDKWDREREAVRHMMNERKRIEQEDERKIISVAQLVEELTNLAPGLFPTKPRPSGVAPTPPVRRKSKSREASPLLERRDLSRESSVGRDEAKTNEMSEILYRLSEAAQQLRKHSDTDRTRRSLSVRAGSTDSDSGLEPLTVKMRSGLKRSNSNLRKSFSLEQTQQEQQEIWRPDSESREGSVQSIDDETYQRIMMSRESGMDSRLSGGSTRSEIVTSSEKKKKSGLFGKLKKLARSRSIESDNGSDIGSTSQISDAGSLRLQKKPPSSSTKKTKKT